MLRCAKFRHGGAVVTLLPYSKKTPAQLLAGETESPHPPWGPQPTPTVQKHHRLIGYSKSKQILI